MSSSDATAAAPAINIVSWDPLTSPSVTPESGPTLRNQHSNGSFRPEPRATFAIGDADDNEENDDDDPAGRSSPDEDDDRGSSSQDNLKEQRKNNHSSRNFVMQMFSMLLAHRWFNWIPPKLTWTSMKPVIRCALSVRSFLV